MVKTNSSEEIEAKLVAADEDKITLEWQAREPKKIGKGKETVQKKAEILYQNIKEAIVIVSF
jgi:ribosome maturation factor RimP